MEWISVKDRLPENFKDVLIYDTYDGYIVAAYQVICENGRWYMSIALNEGWLINNCCEPDLKNVTHWMPLPQEPKKVHCPNCFLPKTCGCNCCGEDPECVCCGCGCCGVRCDVCGL